MKRKRSTTSSIRNAAVPDLLDLHPAHHLARDHLDVLVVDVDALQAVDLLDLVDQVALQLLLAAHAQDVVRVDRAVHQRLARADALAFLDVDVRAARQLVLARLGVVAGHEELAVLLLHVAVLTVPSISVMSVRSDHGASQSSA
jgi:hypothetical protein